MIIAGVDLGGRKIAVSLFDDKGLASVRSVLVPKTTRAQELWELAEWFGDLIRVADLVVVEEPFIGRGTRASLQLAHTAGAVLYKLGERTLHTKSQFVEVSTWKKETVGSGNANKEDVRMWLEREYPAYATQCGADQDRIDATCIGLYGVRLQARAAQLEEL